MTFYMTIEPIHLLTEVNINSCIISIQNLVAETIICFRWYLITLH